MATVKLKEAPELRTRYADLACTEGVRSDITFEDDHTVVIDEPPERGGKDAGASPLLHLTAALGSCQTVQIVKVAEAMRFEHGAINIRTYTSNGRLEGEHDNNIILRFSGAEMHIDIETDEEPKRLERLKLLSEDRCPVAALFTDAGCDVQVVWNVLPMKG